jgi:hypothetical protein
MNEQELAEYRAMLAELMQRCLESIRAVKVPDDVEPLWTPRD